MEAIRKLHEVQGRVTAGMGLLNAPRQDTMTRVSTLLLAVVLVLVVTVPLRVRAAEAVLRVGLTGTAQQTEAEASRKIAAQSTPLRLAVVVLDPGIPESEKKQDQQGIWPELRKTEAIRSAVLIANAVRDLHSFERVQVVPDASLTADLYLTGRIDLSDGERLRIHYSLKDITGNTWFKNEVAFHRVEVGWYLRHENDGSEPFQPVYDQVSNRIKRALNPLVASHAKQVRKNAQRARSGKSKNLSQIDRIVMTRRGLFAQYFAPDRYAGIVSSAGNGLKLNYLPNVGDEDWTRILAIQQRDDAFAEHVHDIYGGFAAEIQDPYYIYQMESFPVARALRLSRRTAAYSKVLGAVLVGAAVAQAADGMEGTGDRDRAKILAGVGAIASAVGMMKGANARASLTHLNEISKSFHDSVKPTRVEVSGEVVELTGTVHEQYTQWRQLLVEEHRRNQLDTDVVLVVSDP